MVAPKVAKVSGRGSKPGERRGGRRKGVPNKATAEIKQLARLHAAKAMKELARLAVEGESGSVRVAAIKELFDRRCQVMMMRRLCGTSMLLT